jgi:hypothetical protein
MPFGEAIENAVRRPTTCSVRVVVLCDREVEVADHLENKGGRSRLENIAHAKEPLCPIPSTQTQSVENGPSLNQGKIPD